MASSKEYLNFILEQLGALEEITHRAMMGEYIIYYRGKIAAYICDDRLLVKIVPAAEKLLPAAPHEPPYPGAKDMLLVEEVDDREFLVNLFAAMCDELPAPRPQKKKQRP
ncbi:MAG: TfoX/Sxy family protein [Syntrophomonadaceae bacterium]|nr:TfoX/Sxy family protein [Syntrophomonadaceae bacterium]